MSLEHHEGLDVLSNVNHGVLIQHELQEQLLLGLLRYAETIHFLLLVQQLHQDVVLVILHNHQLAIVDPAVKHTRGQ